jgi:hypothetical protein
LRPGSLSVNRNLSLYKWLDVSRLRERLSIESDRLLGELRAVKRETAGRTKRNSLRSCWSQTSLAPIRAAAPGVTQKKWASRRRKAAIEGLVVCPVRWDELAADAPGVAP